ncbi:hypothetical protein POL68_38100 [Stigmatella sp. ncwal1]|uniref:DUF4440 domain-containing protein n=1 Tax=Stigmatella ashevillensis TaxID=2995309 RepID=A0ABT5DKZ1_9BACT|nr:hypothetical protein [Stigmatella ashevillena]MDC0714330.1 hypothetical protein [Stigmatella ashevillena]
MRLPVSLLLLALLCGACAHTAKSSGLEGLRPVVEDFYKRLRWKDFRGVSRHLIPERREAFLQARRDMQDERDLSITDYEILEVGMTPDGMRATVTGRIQWMRLPSVSEQTATTTSEFIYQGGVWLLERQLEGPFAGELP